MRARQFTAVDEAAHEQSRTAPRRFPTCAAAPHVSEHTLRVSVSDEKQSWVEFGTDEGSQICEDILTIARYAAPFFGLLCVAVAILSVFPQIALWLPGTLN